MRAKTCWATALLLLISQVGCESDSTRTIRIQSIQVAGPVITAGPPNNASSVDLAAFGFVEREFFYEGNATSYRFAAPPAPDGFWSAAEVDSASYRTRLLVRRPQSAEDFSGVVFVEWMNVTSAADLDADWGLGTDVFLREGHAWVGVSAQIVGVAGGDSVLDGVEPTGGLIGTNPERYGSLSHPGDVYSFDMFSQAGRALTNPAGPAPLGELQPTHLVATGASQSAFFLTTYVNAIHPMARVYDGILLHSRGGGAVPLQDEFNDGFELAVPVRTDLREPVFIVQAETDLTALNYLPARQPDTNKVRLWELAGTAHADTSALTFILGMPFDPISAAQLVGCDLPINDGPHREHFHAAVHHMARWVRDGNPPPLAPRLEIAADDPPTIDRDELGIALGGIRNPEVDVPVATLSGDPGPGSEFCFLFGSTTPFDEQQLSSLYTSRDDYLDAYQASAQATVAAGFLLQPEADAMIERAERRQLF